MSIAVFKRLLNLNFALELLESEDQGKIISSPKVVTQNKKAANIQSSEQTYYRENTINQGVVSESYRALSASTTLSVTPQVTNDGAISMQINVQKQDFGSVPAAGPPNTNSRSVGTNVLVDNGSTIVVGGLYRNASTSGTKGIPFLRNLPLVAINLSS